MEGPAPSEMRVVGRYVLLDEIAKGGMAVVHIGRMRGPVGFTRTVAIKRLLPNLTSDPEFVSMFLDEARVAARVQHPNVIATLDVVAESGELFLVMEYVHGDSLARLLKTCRKAQRPIDPHICSAIATGVLYGLHAAHEARLETGEALDLVHRDICPQNVLVGADGVPRVLDFGIAKARARTHETRAGILKGRLAYMAPEQVTTAILDRRTDVCATGAVLWEMLAGERLHRGATPVDLITSILNRTPDPLCGKVAGVPQEVDAILARALSKSPSDRFDTAWDMAVALERALAPATVRQVGEWVNETSGAHLQALAAKVAAIQGASHHLPELGPGTPARATNGPPVSVHPLDSAAAYSSVPPRASGVPLDHGPGAAPAQLLPTPTSASGWSRRRLRLFSGLTGATLLALLAAVLWFSIAAPDPQTARPSLDTRSIGSLGLRAPNRWTALPPPPAGAPATGSAAFAPAAETHVSGHAGPVDVASSDDKATGQQRSRTAPKSGRRSAPAPNARGASCTPPYTIDARGVKSWKPECVH